jgi:transcriptional regulator GlxA family with amidase domain
MLFGIFLYEGAEPIDLATFGVLSMARRLRPEIGICTITPNGGITTLASGLRIVADHAIATAPALDVLVVTGGPGWVAQSRSVATLDFIRRQAGSALIVSVCTGGRRSPRRTHSDNEKPGRAPGGVAAAPHA